MTPEEWENLCDGCGRCCRLLGTMHGCKGLDTNTKRCTVYDVRHETYPCSPVTPDNVMALHARGTLPDSCAYVRHESGQPPKEPPVFFIKPYDKAPQFVKDAFAAQTKVLRDSVSNDSR